MKIILASEAGFCFGVKRAVEKAFSLETDKKKYCLGQLIHNDSVNKKLKEKGFEIEEDILKIENGSLVLIRSHGIGKEVYRTLQNKGCEIVDCTCSFVVKIHNIVEKEYNDGKTVIILGSPEHPEVRGINGFACNRALIFSDISEVKLEKDLDYALVSQTTFNVKKFNEISEFIKKSVNSLVIYNTICYTTQRRQNEVCELAKKCDAMLILGDKNSSNTTKLKELSLCYCKNTFQIDSVSQLKEINFKSFNEIGISAGASTPSSLIEEVTTFMSNTQDNIIDENIQTVEAVEETAATTETTENTVVETAAEEKAVEQVETVEAKEAEVKKASKPAKKREPLYSNDDAMGRLLNEERKSSNTTVGKRLTVKILQITDDGLYVSLPGKKDGFIDKEDAGIAEYNPADFTKNQEIEVKVIDKKNTKDCVSLSKKIIDQEKAENAKYNEMIAAPEFKFTFTEKVSKGLVGQIGPYKVFMPASQIKAGFVNYSDLDVYLNKEYTVRKIDEKESRRQNENKRFVTEKTIIVSAKVIEEEKNKADLDEFWKVVGENEDGEPVIVKGKVKRIRDDIGAFIGIEGFENKRGFDCLCRSADVSWIFGQAPSEVLKVGETYEFVVLKAERKELPDKCKVTLGYKQLQPTPYELCEDKYLADEIHQATIRKIFPYGALCELEPGVDGFIRIGQICRERINAVSDKLKEGDVVTVKIMSHEKAKINCSIRDALDDTQYSSKTETEATEEDKKVKKDRPDRRRKPKEENDSEAVEEIFTGNSTTSMADLFKNIKIEDNE